MAVTKLISPDVGDLTLQFDNPMKGIDAAMDNFEANRFNNLDRITESIEATAKNITDKPILDVDSLVTEPLAGSKCPAY